MSPARDTPIVGDLSTLPDCSDGPRHLVWWSNLGFMLIEGTGFALAAAAYLYPQSQGPAWPPALLWSGIFTVGLVLSELPNRWVAKRAKAKDERAVRIGVLLMTIVGAVLLVARGFELAHMNIHWTTDAYGGQLLVFGGGESERRRAEARVARGSVRRSTHSPPGRRSLDGCRTSRTI